MDTDTNIIYNIGVDEAGRGPLFGRVYAAAVILPIHNHSITHSKKSEITLDSIKDSKKFTSKEKLRNVASFIQNNAIAWSISYIDEKTIDNINILQATQMAMHNAITDLLDKLDSTNTIVWNALNTKIQVDGNYFRSYPGLEHECIISGDASHKNIAAASILAKLARDDYIDDLCKQYPLLSELYGLHNHYGYGTKKHMEAIQQYGITPWHRQSFGLCKTAPKNPQFQFHYA